MEYNLPILPFEQLPEPYMSAEEQFVKEKKIAEVFDNFDIPINQMDVKPGPVVSFWEIYPGKGVKMSVVRTLKDDIAHSLGFDGTRVICPIQGRGTIGIEIPNHDRQNVTFKAVASTKEFMESDMDLPLALGVDVEGNPFVVDLTKMPHMLIADATGMGKSMIQHSVISSLLLRNSPEDLKLVLIDPKKVEHTAYAYIGNYLASPATMEEPLMTEIGDIVTTIESLCEVMDRRYKLLKMADAPNVKEYNKKVAKGGLDSDIHKHMPYIVVVIDEYSDMMMTAGRAFEQPLCQLAQLSRAVGIHLVISTQRPSASIITGFIKANFPCRICCRVTSKYDSRIVLDNDGAERLIGSGDMLFQQNAGLIRIQGAYIDEVNDLPALCKQIIEQNPQKDKYNLPAPPQPKSQPTNMEIGDYEFVFADSLFEDVARFFVENQIVSTSLVQRHFCIGYNRAGRLMDLLESAGIIKSKTDSYQKELLINDMDSLTELIEEIKARKLRIFLMIHGFKPRANSLIPVDSDEGRAHWQNSYIFVLEDEIEKFINAKGKVTVADIQREFTLGYNRIYEILAELEQSGKIKRTNNIWEPKETK